MAGPASSSSGIRTPTLVLCSTGLGLSQLPRSINSTLDASSLAPVRATNAFVLGDGLGY